MQYVIHINWSRMPIMFLRISLYLQIYLSMFTSYVLGPLLRSIEIYVQIKFMYSDIFLIYYIITVELPCLLEIMFFFSLRTILFDICITMQAVT